MVESSSYKFVSTSAEATHRWGQGLGRYLKDGSVVALNGPLGSGKTCLVQGIAKGLEVDSREHVTSPTFTIMNEYQGRITLYHVDFYRIDNSLDLEDVGVEDVVGKVGTTVVEWADKLPSILPQERLSISFRIIDDVSRELEVEAVGSQVIEVLTACRNWNLKKEE